MKMYVYQYFYESKSFLKQTFDIEKMFVNENLLFKLSNGIGNCYETINDVSWIQAELFSVREISKEEENKFIKYISKYEL